MAIRVAVVHRTTWPVVEIDENGNRKVYRRTHNGFRVSWTLDRNRKSGERRPIVMSRFVPDTSTRGKLIMGILTSNEPTPYEIKARGSK